MERPQFLDDDFKTAIRLARAQARVEILQAGVSVFYRDRVRRQNIIEHPNGRNLRSGSRWCTGQDADDGEIYTQSEAIKPADR
jgi:hypothetical protein